MKKTGAAVFVFLFIFCLILQPASAEVEFSQQLYKDLAQNKNDIPYIDLPAYKRIELNNRMVIYLVEDDRLPIIEVTGYLKGGRTQETKQTAGISSFMFEMMNTGTKNRNEQEFKRYKELNGIDIGFNVSSDYYSFSADALSIDKEDLIGLLAEVLRRPDFDARYYNRIKKERARSLAQAKTRQSSLLSMYYHKNIYDSHPYSFSSNIDLRRKALTKITPEKLQEFYNNNIAPNTTVLGVIGDFEIEQMEDLIRKEFGDWKQKEVKIKTPEVKTDNKPENKFVLVNKPDATQAKIRMGYNFFDYNFDRRVEFKMANFVYGGGDFSSRLMENLRSEKGYVYGVQAGTSYYQHGGDYYIDTSVKPAKSLTTVKAVKKELEAIKTGKKPIKKEELNEIINLYNGLLPKSYDSRVKVLDDIIYNSEIRGRQPDYVNEFISQYNSLTVEQVQKSFEEFTYPDRIVTVIVGNKKDILPQFKEEDIKVEVVEPNK